MTAAPSLTRYKYGCICSYTMVSKAARALRRLFQPATTGAELARKLGVSRAAVSGYLVGDFLPTPQTMRAIEDETGIPMRDWTEPCEESEEGATGADHG